VTLEILDSKGAVVRRFASDEKPRSVQEKSLVFPAYWVKESPVLSAKAGMHRWGWDLHYAAPGDGGGPTMGRRGGGGNWALPWTYLARLTANGKTYSQPLTVTMDPRVKTTQADLEAQFDSSQKAVAGMQELAKPAAVGTGIAKQFSELKPKLNAEIASAGEEFEKRLTEVLGPPPPSYGTPVIPVDTDYTSVRYVLSALRQVQGAMQSADVAPTPDQLKALDKYLAQEKTTLSEWEKFVATDFANFNQKLKAAGMKEISLEK
jgi:hypothetical protein